MPMPRKAAQKVQRDAEQRQSSEPKATRRDKTKRVAGSWPARDEEEESHHSNEIVMQRLEDDPDILIGLSLPIELSSEPPTPKMVAEEVVTLPPPPLPPPFLPPPPLMTGNVEQCSELSGPMLTEDLVECSELPGPMVAEEVVEPFPQVQSTENRDDSVFISGHGLEHCMDRVASSSPKNTPRSGEGSDENHRQPPVPGMPSSSSLQSSPYRDDLKVAESIASERGLPPDLKAEEVREFLIQYGYDALDHQRWSSACPEHLSQLSISLSNHIEFGNHTQYEFICRVQPRQDAGMEEVTWRTIRRLKHIRGGLHDPVKKALGSQYNQHFGRTPFAHHTAPAGTTARLQAWFASLSTCTNLGVLEPALVAQIFRLLDGPGTPLQGNHSLSFSTAKDFEQIPVTASMFGSKHLALHQGQGPSHGQMNTKQAPYALPFSKGAADPAVFELTFDVQGLERKVQIFHRPLGAEFSKRSSGPIIIGKVKPWSHADQLGLQTGWVVKSVGGIDVRKLTFVQTQDAMKAGLMSLPFAAEP